MSIKVASKDTVKVVRTLEAGQAFGELALLKTGGRRAASVVTTMASEFLTIDGKQYQQLLAQLQREELKAKVDVLRRAPLFRFDLLFVVLLTTAMVALWMMVHQMQYENKAKMDVLRRVPLFRSGLCLVLCHVVVLM